MTIANASINVLPLVYSEVKIFFTVELSTEDITTNGLFDVATIIETKILYGNVTVNVDRFMPLDNKPTALLVRATYDDIEYIDILYYKAIYAISTPNNFVRLKQKIPEGIFNNITVDVTNNTGNNSSRIGEIIYAKALMINDYYDQYYQVVNQLYASIYNPKLEYMYNGSYGLLKNSSFPDDIIQLFAKLGSVALNVFDLELFISQYIYFRLNIESAIYIDDKGRDVDQYWILGISRLGENTRLAPNEFQINLSNIQWRIYNIDSQPQTFKDELIELIQRISRADINNMIDFSIYDDPLNDIDDTFITVGPTYKNDPRLLYGKCIKYIGKEDYPLNIIGYTNQPRT